MLYMKAIPVIHSYCSSGFVNSWNTMVSIPKAYALYRQLVNLPSWPYSVCLLTFILTKPCVCSHERVWVKMTFKMTPSLEIKPSWKAGGFVSTPVLHGEKPSDGRVSLDGGIIESGSHLGKPQLSRFSVWSDHLRGDHCRGRCHCCRLHGERTRMRGKKILISEAIWPKTLIVGRDTI